MQNVDPMYEDEGCLDPQSDESAGKTVLLLNADGEQVPALPTSFDTRNPSHLALDVFKTFLGKKEDRHNLSNMLDLWDLIPRFSAEGYNTSDGSKNFPNSISRDFRVGKTRMHIVQTPGYYTKPTAKNKDEKGRRYPGQTECMVEQALIKIAADHAYLNPDDAGDSTPFYSFSFTIGDIQRVMKTMGTTRNKRDIKNALEVLKSSEITITGHTDSHSYNEQTSLITDLRWITHKAGSTNSGIWNATLNRIISQGITNLGYRQYRLDEAKSLKYFGIYVYRKLMVEKLNLTLTRGLSFLFSEIRDLTFGLHYAEIYKGVGRLNKELDKMKELGIISGYDVSPIRERPSGNRRPVNVDAEYVVYPSERTLGQMKAASAKTRAGSVILGKSMDNHNEERFQLPLPLSIDKK